MRRPRRDLRRILRLGVVLSGAGLAACGLLLAGLLAAGAEAGRVGPIALGALAVGGAAFGLGLRSLRRFDREVRGAGAPSSRGPS